MNQQPELKRVLTLFPATALVIGTVVGTGIFVSSAEMARQLGNANLLIAVWVCAGLMSLFGALTLCELVGQMPHTGGTYIILTRVFGDFIGFSCGWANFTIALTGALSGIAYIFGSYFNEFIALPHLSPAYESWALQVPLLGNLFPFADFGIKLVGIALIVFLTIVNILGVQVGAWLQSISTSTKFIAILGVVFVAFFLYSGPSPQSTSSHIDTSSALGIVGAIAASLSSAFWAYDGWSTLPAIGGEVKNPERTMPRAIVIGALAIMALYVLVNLAYVHVLSIDQIATAANDRVATELMSAVLGSQGAFLVALLILFSAFDIANSSILLNARVYYAMAVNHRFVKSAALVHQRFQTPHRSLIYQGMWASVLLFSGSFDLIISMFVFVNWFFYMLQGVAVFVLRKREPDAPRPFRTPGYPLVPLIFVLFSLAFLILTLVNDIVAFQDGQVPIIKSLMGIALVLTGLPFYLFWRRRKASSN